MQSNYYASLTLMAWACTIVLPLVGSLSALARKLRCHALGRCKKTTALPSLGAFASLNPLLLCLGSSPFCLCESVAFMFVRVHCFYVLSVHLLFHCLFLLVSTSNLPLFGLYVQIWIKITHLNSSFKCENYSFLKILFFETSQDPHFNQNP